MIDPGPGTGDPARRVAVFVPPVLFDEGSFLMTYRSLVHADWSPVIVGADTIVATGFEYTIVRPELRREALEPGDFAGLVLVGGTGAILHWQDSTLLAAARDFAEAGKPVAAIGLAVPILARAGVLEGLPAAFFPEAKGVPLVTGHGARFSFGPVVSADGVVTAVGAEAAREFAVAFIAALETRR